MTGSDREREAETLAAFLRTIPSKRETETFGQYDRRRARAVLASDWLAAHDKAIADEAAAEALAGHRCQVGGDGWSAARGRGSVGGDQ